MLNELMDIACGNGAFLLFRSKRPQGPYERSTP
jgi:hypothetical protein